MQRGHCDDSQQAFPPASCNADIAPRESRRPTHAMAGGAKTSGWNTWPGVSQRVDHRTSSIAASPAMLGPQWRRKMFASESCSEVGCFLEAALPVIAPAVALVWMLSIAAFPCWAT